MGHGAVTGIDELYQLPLDEFTAARNDLAKSTGDASIKKLEKPNLAAWAVNQLYWQKRKLYDEVIKTSGQVRTAYKQMLAGKSADVRAAEVFHSEAMRKAKDAIRAILESAGNSAADAVMTPVTETLDALPTTDPPGRLTKPLRRTGFEALQGVTIAAKPSKPVAKPEPKKPAPDETERDAQEARGRTAGARDGEGALAFCGSGGAGSGSVGRSRQTNARSRRTHARTNREASWSRRRWPRRPPARSCRPANRRYEKAKAESERLRKKIG